MVFGEIFSKTGEFFGQYVDRAFFRLILRVVLSIGVVAAGRVSRRRFTCENICPGSVQAVCPAVVEKSLFCGQMGHFYFFNVMREKNRRNLCNAQKIEIALSYI